MRITTNNISDTLLQQYSSLAARQNALQTQAATGQRIQHLEDDPTAVRRVLELQTESSANTQYQRNIANLQEASNHSYGVLKAIKKVSDRAGELAILADGTKPLKDLQIYAAEVNELIKRAVESANAQNQGNYALAGTNTTVAPFVMTVDAAGLVTSVTYQGNESVASNEISNGVTLSVQAIGVNTSGTGPRGLVADPRYGADFFNHLISLRDNLNSGNTTAIAATDRGNLKKDEENFLFHTATTGAVQARLEAAATILTNRNLELDKLVSRDVDADLAETLTKLSQTQNAYRAALQSGATLLNVSLMDYLR